MIEIIPAILTKNDDVFKNQLNQAEKFGAQTIQIDFVDGEFVNGNTIMPDNLDAFVLSSTTLTLEAHLMTKHPEQYFATLYTLGFSRIAIHLETLERPLEIIEEIREYGMELGFAINPDTKLEDVDTYINDLDFILFLTVIPGEQGHPFESQVLNKIHIEHVHGLKERHKDVTVEVDGGIKKHNVAEVVQVGVDRIVIGSEIWKANNPKDAYTELCRLVL